MGICSRWMYSQTSSSVQFERGKTRMLSPLSRRELKIFHNSGLWFFGSHWPRESRKNQRPELWNIFNSRLDKGESIRVFPLSNWTEFDVWLYIHVEKIPIVPLYFAKERDVVLRNGSIVVIDRPSQLLPGEKTQRLKCRMRSLGCVPCTGAIRSDAGTVPQIIQEMVSFRRSERENRAIDHDEEGSMELKKREGYF